MPTLTNIDVEFVSLVDRAAVRDPSNPTQPQRFLIWKRENGVTPTGGSDMTPEENTAALKKAEDERDELRKQTEELTAKVAELEKAAKKPPAKPDNDGDEDDLAKADLPPAVRARLEKAEAQARASEERIVKAEELAKSERELRLNREYVTKAQDYHSLPVNADEFGPVLKAVAEKLSKEEAAAIDTVLKAAENRIRANDQILKELGAAGDGPALAGDDGLSQEDIVRKAAEIRKADPALSEFEAMRRAMGGRDQQAAYLQSHR